jgi:hypothetical protein
MCENPASVSLTVALVLQDEASRHSSYREDAGGDHRHLVAFDLATHLGDEFLAADAALETSKVTHDRDQRRSALTGIDHQGRAPAPCKIECGG